MKLFSKITTIFRPVTRCLYLSNPLFFQVLIVGGLSGIVGAPANSHAYDGVITLPGLHSDDIGYAAEVVGRSVDKAAILPPTSSQSFLDDRVMMLMEN